MDKPCGRSLKTHASKGTVETSGTIQLGLKDCYEKLRNIEVIVA